MVGPVPPGTNENFDVTFYDTSAGGMNPNGIPGTLLCTNVPAPLVGSQWVGHCVTSFDTIGTHVLVASSGTAPDIVITTDELDEEVTAPVAFDANQFALTGSWYNPATSGQGLELQVYPDWNGAGDGLLFGGWFTYDTQGNQQWVTLQGNLAASHGASYDLGIYLNTGGTFDAPPITTAVADGTATLTFYDCTDAALTYSFTDGRSGTIPYVRLSNTTGCSSADPAVTPMPLPANYNDVLHSGAWYNPATSGQGMNVDIIPSQTTFFATWYTYAPLAVSGAETGLAGQRWFSLQSNAYTPGDLTLADVPIYSNTGGIFNQPSAVTSTQVGTANIAFISCTAMTLDYTFTAGEFSGLSGSIDEQSAAAPPGCQ